MTIVRCSEHCRGTLWRGEWPLSEAWLVHNHCFLSCIQKEGFLTSEKDFKTLIFLFGDERAAHPEVYSVLPHPPRFQCSVQCICGQGETCCHPETHQDKIFSAKLSNSKKKIIKKKLTDTFFRKEREPTRGC